MKKDEKNRELKVVDVIWLILLFLWVVFINVAFAKLIDCKIVSADQQIETRRFPNGKVKVDGVEIAGTDRNIELPRGWEASVVSYDIRSYPSDIVKGANKEGLDTWLRFFKQVKEKGYVTNTITFVVISKDGLEYEIDSGTNVSFKDKKGKPIKFNFKKTWKEFDSESGIYIVDGLHMRDLPHTDGRYKNNDEIGYWAIDSNTPKEVDGKLVPSGRRVQQFQSILDIWGVNGYAPQSPTRDVLTQFNKDNPPADGSYGSHKYFKRSGDAAISDSVAVKENGIYLAGEKYQKMKNKDKMSLNWVDVEVDENAFELNQKEKKQVEKQEENKKKSEKKDDKNQNWWDKLISWLLYDEEFVKEQFNSVISGVGAPEGTRAFEVNANGGSGTLYEWALNQGQWSSGYGGVVIYGGHDVLDSLGTGYHQGYWQTITKNFTKFIFTLAANYFIMKKFFKRLK